MTKTLNLIAWLVAKNQHHNFSKGTDRSHVGKDLLCIARGDRPKHAGYTPLADDPQVRREVAWLINNVAGEDIGPHSSYTHTQIAVAILNYCRIPY